MKHLEKMSTAKKKDSAAQSISTSQINSTEDKTFDKAATIQQSVIKEEQVSFAQRLYDLVKEATMKQEKATLPFISFAHIRSYFYLFTAEIFHLGLISMKLDRHLETAIAII